ncbi:MAG: MCP four helix bundle domain-containing protein, partial [Spirochaetota bacterium]
MRQLCVNDHIYCIAVSVYKMEGGITMKWFNNRSIMFRLLLGFITVALLAGAVGFVGITNILNITAADKQLYEKATLGVQYIGEISANFQRTRVLTRDIMGEKDPEKKKAIVVKIRATESLNEESIRKYESTAVTSADREGFARIQKYFTEYKNFMVRITDFALRNDTAGAAAMISGEGAILLANVDGTINDLTAAAVKKAKDTSDSNIVAATEAVWFMVIVMFVAMVSSISFGIFIALSITRPVSKGLLFAKKLAAGDFTGRIDLDQKDELGQLSNALNTAADDLEKM